MARVQPVVGVEESDVATQRGVDAGVAGGGQATVVPTMHRTSAADLGAHAVEHLGGAVRRRVVDQHELDAVAGVVHQGAGEGGQEGGGVEARNDDAHSRMVRHLCSLARCFVTEWGFLSVQSRDWPTATSCSARLRRHRFTLADSSFTDTDPEQAFGESGGPRPMDGDERRGDARPERESAVCLPDRRRCNGDRIAGRKQGGSLGAR